MADRAQRRRRRHRAAERAEVDERPVLEQRGDVRVVLAQVRELPRVHGQQDPLAEPGERRVERRAVDRRVVAQ